MACTPSRKAPVTTFYQYRGGFSEQYPSSSARLRRQPPYVRFERALPVRSPPARTARPTLAMNQLFYIEELVHRIAFSVDGGSSGTASLLALACCCKPLESPIMDVLWRRQTFLPIILRTLPVDCWTAIDGLYRLIRTPTTKEWERFRTYTHRVVELHVGRSFIGEVSPETISFLGIRSTLDQLWPRLTSLRLSNKPGWNSLVSTLGFLSPKVKTLTLILPRNPSILLRPVLSTASVRCNQVQELVLDVVADDPHSAHWVGEFIAASRDTLRTLEIQSPFRGEYLPAIANLPHLWKLRLDKAHFPSDLPPNSFPVLEEFIFPRFQGRRLYHFLRNLRTTSLKVAKIYSTDPVDFTELAAVLSRFSESLMFLEISAVTGLDLFSATVLRSPFTNLRVLHLRCFRYGEAPHSSCTFRPSDQSIADLGASMPYLTNLSLGSPNCIHLQYATFLSLVSLSKTCCDLETLEIKIDFETMITLPHSAPEGAGSNAVPDKTRGSGCRLRKLALGLSIIPDCPGAGWVVAIGLGKIFPSLAEVWGCGPERYRWEEVWTNIKASQQVLRAMGQ